MPSGQIKQPVALQEKFLDPLPPNNPVQIINAGKRDIDVRSLHSPCPGFQSRDIRNGSIGIAVMAGSLSPDEIHLGKPENKRIISLLSLGNIFSINKFHTYTGILRSISSFIRKQFRTDIGTGPDMSIRRENVQKFAGRIHLRTGVVKH